MPRFDTALREYVLQKIGELGQADIVIGVPTYNAEETIVGVLTNIYRGLEKYYPDRRAVVSVSDGGSLDYTRELAQKTKSPTVPKIVAIYRGLGGKGTSLRAVFQAAERLGAQAAAVVDAYENLAELHGGLEFDLHQGLTTVEQFAAGIGTALDDFLSHPFGSPLIPN